MSSKSISHFPRDRESKVCAARDGDPASRGAEHNVLLVDDQPHARWRVRALLRRERHIREIATAQSSAEALALARRCRPRVCLISAALGQGEALPLAGKMKQLMNPPRILILADIVDTDLAGAAIIAGADGVLSRYAVPDDPVDAVGRAADGEQHFPTLCPDEVLRLLDRVEDRDRAIVAMLLERVPSDEVARTLGISAHVLDLRRKSILKDLGGALAKGDSRGDDRESNRALAGSALGVPDSDGV
jgi:DNA-binding NarL/FixJ family response regulator